MSSSASALDPSLTWYRVGNAGLPHEGDRLHVRVNERYLTIFRQRGRLSALDSICHHASGPLTAGPLQDVEDLGVTVVLCPWHKFMVSIDEGRKVYQGVDFVAGKPVPSGWKIGKVVQRAHKVVERVDGLYVVRLDLSPPSPPTTT
eukprot:scaffold988_cov165-Ochromonas_danica.AAC.39